LDAPHRKYLMVVTDGGTTISQFDTHILESSQITGPFIAVLQLVYRESTAAKWLFPPGVPSDRSSSLGWK
jgi:hypothetical protein